MRMRDIMTICEAPYREEPTSTFGSGGDEFNINAILAAVEGDPIRMFRVADLAWLLAHSRPDDQSRVERADLRAPILVCRDGSHLLVVDGLHRLAKAVEMGVQELPGRFVTNDVLAAARVQQ
ncbi:MAG: hypothetical protein ACLGIM_12240 [Alphaproteobacteria bacterium]